jgi:predicted HicB family RNase H-like nuclease
MKDAASTIAELDRINLRLSGETFRSIDAARGARAGRISRNTWIAEAIEEKLVREASDADAVVVRRVSNA